MYIYRLKQEKMDQLKGFFLVLLVVVCVAALYYLFAFLAFVTKISWIQVLPFIFVITGAFFFAQKKLVGYTYTINEGSLLIEKNTSKKRSKVLVETSMKKLLWAGDFNDIPAKYADAKIVVNTFKKKTTGKAVIYKDSDGTLRGTVISPSEKFFSHIEEAVSKNSVNNDKADGKD